MSIYKWTLHIHDNINLLTSGCPVTSPLDLGESTHASNLTFKSKHNKYCNTSLQNIMTDQSCKLSPYIYTAKKARVTTRLFTSCNNLLQQADIRMRSHGFRQLVTTSLLLVVNRLVASCQQTCRKLVISKGLLQVVSTSCNKSANDKLQQA